jgi:hypothetical protein
VRRAASSFTPPTGREPVVTTLASPRPTRPSRWILPKAPDEQAVRDLAEALSLPEVVCRLLLIRGYVSAEEAKLFLRPKLDKLHDPLLFLSMEKVSRARCETRSWCSSTATTT